MNGRQAIILTAIVAIATCLGVLILQSANFLGFFVGYGAGLLNVQWLFRDAEKAVELDIKMALRLYRKSLAGRLGLITMVVAVVWRFQPDWLFSLAWGIAAGIIIPLILAIRQKILKEGGER